MNEFPNALEFFPCEVEKFDKYYRISITADNFLHFFDLLEEYGLYGNGPCWEGLVEQILERDMPEVLEKVDFDSESDACLLLLQDADIQLKIAKHIHAICTNEPRFREYLEWIDKDRIDA